MSVFLKGLLDEMANYEPESGFRTDKARRVYYMAIEHGKLSLAKKIAAKHKKEIRSDMAMAMANMLMLQAIKNTEAH